MTEPRDTNLTLAIIDALVRAKAVTLDRALFGGRTDGDDPVVLARARGRAVRSAVALTPELTAAATTLEWGPGAPLITKLWPEYGGEDTLLWIEDLNGLEACTGLRRLHLEWAAVAELAPIAGLVALESLALNGSFPGEPARPTDLRPLAKLVNLTDLRLWNTAVTSLGPLALLPKLRELALADGAVTDLWPLAGCPSLARLRLLDTPVRDLTPLLACRKLKELTLYAAAEDDGPDPIASDREAREVLEALAARGVTIER